MSCELTCKMYLEPDHFLPPLLLVQDYYSSLLTGALASPFAINSLHRAVGIVIPAPKSHHTSLLFHILHGPLSHSKYKAEAQARLPSSLIFCHPPLTL